MKQLFILLFFSLLPGILFAQGKGRAKRTAEEKARFYTDEMVKDLELSKEQESKIYEINLVVSKQFDSLYTAEPDRELSRKGAVIIYKNRDEAFKNVLSIVQFLRYDDIQREKREKRQKERMEREKGNMPEEHRQREN